MKKNFILGICLYIAAIGISKAQQSAGNGLTVIAEEHQISNASATKKIELFRFTMAQEVNNEEWVLHHDRSDNTANLVKKSNADFNATDGYLQAFILKRLENGKVLIASAKRNNHFLYHDPATGNVTFSTIENDSNIEENFTWQLQFAGVGKIHICPLGDLTKGLVKQSDNTIKIETLQASSSGGTQIGDEYKFTIEKIANVL